MYFILSKEKTVLAWSCYVSPDTYTSKNANDSITLTITSLNGNGEYCDFKVGYRVGNTPADVDNGGWTTGDTQTYCAAGVWYLIVKPADNSADARFFGPYIKDAEPPNAPSLSIKGGSWGIWQRTKGNNNNSGINIMLHDNKDNGSKGSDSFNHLTSEACSGIAGDYISVSDKESDSYYDDNIQSDKWYPEDVYDQDGWYYVKSYAEDKAENRSSITKNEFGIDNSPPTGDADIPDERKTSTGFDIVAENVDDNGCSGVNNVEFIVNGKSQKFTENKSKKYGIHIDADKDVDRAVNNIIHYDIKINATDNVGNSRCLYNDTYDFEMPIPQNGSISVVKADYKDPNNMIYWVKPGSIFKISTDGYFPSSCNIYPDTTYLNFVNSNAGNINFGVTPEHYANIENGSNSNASFYTYFNLLDKENKAERTTKNNCNYVGAIHTLSAKDDQNGASFYLYCKNSYKNKIFSDYSGGEICLNVDGKSPRGSASIDFDDSTLNADISVDDVYDDGSGVKDVYAELYSSADPNNKIRKDLKIDEDGTWKLPEFNAYSIFKSDDIIIEVYAEDNVGNIGLLGQGTYDLFGVSAQIVPYNDQNFKGIPTLMKGQDAILEIYTTGAPTELQITFPDKLTDLDSTLNRTIKINPEDYLTTPYEFKIPLYVQDDEADYTVNVKAVKGNKNKEANAEMYVTGNILNGIRTRTRSSNAP